MHLVLRLRGGCFAGDTLVSTVAADGAMVSRRIDSIVAGDTVLIWHTESKQTQQRTVSALQQFDVNELATLTLSDGRQLRATTNHALYVQGKGWSAVEPEKQVEGHVSLLREGDLLQTADGSKVSVRRIEVHQLPSMLSVFTLLIEPTDADLAARSSLLPSVACKLLRPEANFFACGVLAHNGSDGMQILVQLPNTPTPVPFMMDGSDSIAQLKSKIMQSFHLAIEIQVLSFQGKQLRNEHSLRQCGLGQGSTVQLTTASGLAAGGKITQKIYEDPHPAGSWAPDDASCRVFVHLAGPDLWHRITGRSMPPTPVSAKTYTDAGLPWFKTYDAAIKGVAATKALAGLVDIAEAVQVQGAAAALSGPPPLLPLSASVQQVLQDPSLLVPDSPVLPVQQKGMVDDGEW